MSPSGQLRTPAAQALGVCLRAVTGHCRGSPDIERDVTAQPDFRCRVSTYRGSVTGGQRHPWENAVTIYPSRHPRAFRFLEQLLPVLFLVELVEAFDDFANVGVAFGLLAIQEPDEPISPLRHAPARRRWSFGSSKVSFKMPFIRLRVFHDQAPDGIGGHGEVVGELGFRTAAEQQYNCDCSTARFTVIYPCM